MSTTTTASLSGPRRKVPQGCARLQTDPALLALLRAVLLDLKREQFEWALEIASAQAAVGRVVPFHVVQKLNGHKSLGSLGEYLSASDAEVLAAIER